MLHSVLPKLVLLCLLVFGVKAVKKCRNLKKDGLVPSYVVKVMPQCAVKFSRGVCAKCGNKLLFGATSTEPTIKFKLPKRNCINATIVSIDPDAIGVPPFLHGLSTNIPRKCLMKGYKSSTCKAGDVQASFAPPSFLNHRYLFCVYCQKKYIEPHQYGLLSDFRMRFDMKEYARNHSLSIKACNYFRLKYAPAASDVLKSK